MSIYEEDWNFDREQYVSSRKCGKPLGPGAPHYPNTAERVLLTQMMQRSGKTEEQVRADKGNRQKLAAAQKSMGAPSTWQQKEARRKLESKRQRRRAASRVGVEVWQLKEKNGG